MRANFNLNMVQRKLTDSTNRLSSGYRIGKAADDAAGMAISRKMHAQLRGLHRASQNGSDGISFIQTAEGALTEIDSMLQRCRELSVQAANDGTMTIEDKQAVQNEIDALRSEIDRISTQTEYNTMTLLDGSCCRQSSSSNVGVRLISASDDVRLTTYTFDVTKQATQATLSTTLGAGANGTVSAAEAGRIIINGVTIDVKEGQSYEEVFATLRDYCEMMNIDVVPQAGGTDCEFANATNLSFTSKLYGASQKISMRTDNAALGAIFGVTTPIPGEPGLYGDSGTPGTDAEVTLDYGSGFSKTATMFIDGTRLEVSDRDGFNMIFDLSGVKIAPPDTKSTASVTMLDAGYVAIQIGANEGQTIELSVPPTTSKALNVEHCNVCTKEGATASIAAFNDAIVLVTGIRSKLGAYQNRMDSAVSNLGTVTENLTEACSRIEDTDMSEEMTKYTQYSVLLQAGTSMLAQANNQPQTILQLLQG